MDVVIAVTEYSWLRWQPSATSVTVAVSKVGTTEAVKVVVSDSMKSNEASKIGDASDRLAGMVMG